jgi:hypothetical protein
MEVVIGVALAWLSWLTWRVVQRDRALHWLRRDVHSLARQVGWDDNRDLTQRLGAGDKRTLTQRIDPEVLRRALEQSKRGK